MGRLANQGDLSLPKCKRGRSVAVDSIPGSAIQQGPNFFLFLHLHPAISGDPRKGDGSILERSTRNWQPFKRCDGEKEGEGSAAAARTIDGTLACGVTISAFARSLSLTFEVVEDLIGLVLAGVGEGV